MAPRKVLSRRQFVKDSGGLLIGFSLANELVLARSVAAMTAGGDLQGASRVPAQGVSPVPTPDRLDSWLKIERSGRINVFTGKMECGLGVLTALTQIVAEELDVDVHQVTVVMGDTSLTANQGGVGGSTSVSQGAKPLRNAAATARHLLVELAARRLGTPSDQLEVRNGVVSSRNDPSRTVSYGELAGTELQSVLKVTGDGFNLNAEGPGNPKDPATYTIVGTSVQRIDLPAKIIGEFQFVTDVRVDGMLHGRVVRPPAVGSKVVSVDDNPVKDIKGYVMTVVKGDFVGVVAASEWAAIRSAKALKVTWSAPAPAFPVQEELYRQMRSATPKVSRDTTNQGDTVAALAKSVKKIEASYDYPFQSHATMGPGCAVADVRMDGITTVWSGTQKPHAVRDGVAELLGVASDRVRGIWVEDAASYGRPGFEDAAADAVVLSRAAGKPVRVQWMRADMTAWGTKGPAVACDLVAGIDANGEVSAVQFSSRAFSGGEVLYLPNTAGNFLAGQLMGIANRSALDEFAQWSGPTSGYRFPNLHSVAHVVPRLYDTTSPLRSTHLRDPNGPAIWFAVESFIDEMAAAVDDDPVKFRLKYLSDSRAKAVLVAAAEKAGWDYRVSPRKTGRSEDVLRGRGIAVAPRGTTYVSTVAEVEVNRRTGLVRVKRLTCAHDCGLIVNPDGLRAAIAGNLIQSLGRALKEEVAFSRNTVTSVDWISYPVARASDIPTEVDIVLLNHPDLPPSGAGEPSSRVTAAAIANAVYDATGARVRQAPLTPSRVKAALVKLQSA